MAEILYIFEGFGSSVFAVVALLCFAVGVIGFKYDKLSVIVVSLLFGIGLGYFLSMAAWNDGIGTIYIGSCVGLLMLLVSMKVRPVKRFFLGGVSIFLSVAAIAVVLLNAFGGTTVTYTFRSLEGGSYHDVAINSRQSDLKKEVAGIIGCDVNSITVKLNEDKTQATIDMPSGSLTHLKQYGDAIVAAHSEINEVEVTSYSSWWTVAIIIGAVIGIACGVLTMFKEKVMQIIGTSVFAATFGSIFAYLGLGELSPLLIAPLIFCGAFFLQRYLNVKKENDDTEPDPVALPTV